jgi:hypothetical protein
MVGEPSHVKQLSLNHVCKIGLNRPARLHMADTVPTYVDWRPCAAARLSELADFNARLKLLPLMNRTLFCTACTAY